jgi:hypothetical protein
LSHYPSNLILLQLIKLSWNDSFWKCQATHLLLPKKIYRWLLGGGNKGTRLSIDYSFFGTKNACIDIQMGVCHTIPICYDKDTSLYLTTMSFDDHSHMHVCHINIDIYTFVRVRKRSFVKSSLNLESRKRTETHVFVIERFYHHMGSANY